MNATTLSAAEWRQRLLSTCQRMIDSADRLCQADRDLGDGDHGVTMARAFTAAQTAYGATPAVPGADLAILGAKLMGAGGTAGIVFGTWFTSAGKALGGTEVDGPALAEAMTAAAQAVRNRAKAAPGDKTMIDALLPAVEALRAAAGEGPEVALHQAAAAAAAGVEATRQMIPRLGRARTMGERAVGFIDPGALSVAIIFEGLAATP
jgi:phosphoenolpyruvate---glycerone phosphotransferase subunit DhaL